MFTKQHYVRIAKIICDSTPDNNQTMIEKQALIRYLVDYFKADNPLFAVGKFISACRQNERDGER